MVDNAKTHRLQARVSAETLAVIRRAAEIQGRSLSDFVVTAAQEAAYRAIEEHNIIRLSTEDQKRFVELLLNPPEPSPALKRAFEAHAQIVRESV